LLETSWTKLAEVTTKEAVDMLWENITGLSTFASPCLLNKCCLQWDDVCPSCFEYEFKDPPSAIGSVFSFLEPHIERTSIVLQNCEVLDNVTGEAIKKTIHLEVIFCAPTISSAESEAFKFWAADKSEHTNYLTFVPSALPSTIKPSKAQYWQLICPIGRDSQAMSLI
jgi:hypothetical protein